jgi:hypothetical protein
VSVSIASAQAGLAVTATTKPRKLTALPRPSKTGLNEEERVRLLSREAEACGPHQLTIRYAAVELARRSGDPRLLAGSLDDLAAAAVIWRERTLDDAHKRHTAA